MSWEDLGGSWDEEVGKIATAGSDSHPEDAKSVIRIAFFAVSAEQERGSRRLLAMDISRPDAQGRGVRGEGKPSPIPLPGQITQPDGCLTRPGPRPGEFQFDSIWPNEFNQLKSIPSHLKSIQF